MTVSTAPPGATCTLDRVGERVGAIAQTPGSVRLDKSKHDLTVTCSKEGFQTASVTHAPSFSGATFGNIIAGGVIGIIVDASSGANYYYPGDVRLDLSSSGTPVAAGPPIGTGAPTLPARDDAGRGSLVQPVAAQPITLAPRKADVY